MKNVESLSSEEKPAQQILESTINFEDVRWEVGPLWSEVQLNFANNYGSVLGQLRSLRRRLCKIDGMKTKRQDTRKINLETNSSRKYIKTIHPTLRLPEFGIYLIIQSFTYANQGKSEKVVMLLRSIKGYRCMITYYLNEI